MDTTGLLYDWNLGAPELRHVEGSDHLGTTRITARDYSPEARVAGLFDSNGRKKCLIHLLNNLH